MKEVGRRILGGAVLLVLGAAAGVGGERLWQARHPSESAQDKPAAAKPADEEDEPEPAAVVRTVAAVQGELHRTVEAIGMAALPPTATSIESWPTDVMVTRVLVQAGEAVSKDSPLVQVAITRDAETQIGAAELALESSTKALEVAQQRLERSLATRTDVLAAQTARDEAKQRLERLKTGRPPEDGVLRAHSAGVVGAVRVQAGSTVTAGTPLIEITSGAVVAQVGIDPADAAAVAVGQVFDVRPVDDRGTSHWSGTLSLVSPGVNPTTRLVDGTLTLGGESPPRPGTPLRARAVLPGASGVLIPRAALVPEGDEMIVFVVRDGTAARTPVTIAQRGSDKVLIAAGCTAGDRVVVSGQSQLTPGAVVREVSAEPKPAKPNGGAGADR
jgi:RND family efflux transporter MFP subunit